MKTETAVEAQPYTRFVRGKYWHFVYQGATVPIQEEYGTEAFQRRVDDLLRLFRGGEWVETRLVYFIGWDGGPVKIGMAEDIQARIVTLQTACPYELRVLAMASGGADAERQYHKVFAANRLRGEWFARVPAIEAEIERLRSVPVPLACGHCGGEGSVKNRRGIPRACPSCEGAGKVPTFIEGRPHDPPGVPTHARD